jgi:MEMO1 family protein
MPEIDILSNPRLRTVEAFPMRVNGEDFICLQDPQKLAEQPVFLNQVLVFLVARMDGEHTLRDIQMDFLRASGQVLPMEDLENIVNSLDEQHYLEGPNFRRFCRELVQDFCSAPSRAAFHAGSAYEASRESLTSQIQDYFTHKEGPGTDITPQPGQPLRGLISPHIDFMRGGPTYAHAYAALAMHPGADTFIIFGTCHTAMPQRFSIGTKDYETPLGPATIDRDFVSRLSEKLNGEFADEFSHRGEHSIEFQAVWLRYLLNKKQDFKIVPILVGSFHDLFADGGTAGDNPEIKRIMDAIQGIINESHRRVCIVAGADLAHVGTRFGDSSGPTVNSLQDVAQEDRRFLESVEKGDAEAMFRSIAADNDRRRVCGYPSIYMMLRCIEKPTGKLLQYRQWSDLEAGAAVTYAALAIF